MSSDGVHKGEQSIRQTFTHGGHVTKGRLHGQWLTCQLHHQLIVFG